MRHIRVVIACPHCKEYMSSAKLVSGNTFNALLWSDGKLDAPMFPLEARSGIARCVECKKLFREEDAAEVEFKGSPPKNISVGTLHDLYEALETGFARNQQEELSLRMLAWWYANETYREHPKDYSDLGCIFVGLIINIIGFTLITGSWYVVVVGAALVLLLCSKGIVEYMREKLTSQAEIALKEKALMVRQSNDTSLINNLEKLVTQLDASDPEGCLRKAEAARELGRFDEAIKLLKNPPGQEAHKKAAKIISDLAAKGDRRVRKLWRLQ